MLTRPYSDAALYSFQSFMGLVRVRLGRGPVTGAAGLLVEQERISETDRDPWSRDL